MKLLADDKANVKIATFSVGNTVLVKQHKRNNLASPFNPIPHTTAKIKGWMTTVTSNSTNKCVIRNSSFYKQSPTTLSKRFPIENYNLASHDEIRRHEINDAIERNEISDEFNSSNENKYGEIGDEIHENIPRRNLARERNRPQYLRDDIQNVVNLGN